MIGFHPVVGILLEHVTRARDVLIDDARVDRCSIGRDLDRSGTQPQRAGKERPGSGTVAALREQHVDDLAMLVDGPVEVGPAAGDLDVGLVDKPPIPAGMPARTRGVDELHSEGLHPPVDGHVIDLDAALGEKLLHIAIGQPIAQVPAHRDGDGGDAVAEPVQDR